MESGTLEPPMESAGPLSLGSRADVQAKRLSLALSICAIFAFVLAITIPFAGQALHIDDAIFWDFARTNLESPLQQHMDDYRLMGEQIGQWRDTHPPLDQMYMSLVMRITGSESESPLHLSFIVFPLIAGVSMFFLSRRFTRNAMLSTLLLLATPVVMTMSHTLMADVPMLAFWLAATSAYIYGVDKNDARLLALAGCLAFLAVFAGYQALALMPLLAIYAWVNGKLNLRTALPLALPLAGFLLYALYSLSAYGELPRFTHARGLNVDSDHISSRIEGMLAQIGGASVFPLFLAGFFALRRKRYLLLPLAVAGSVALGVFHYQNGFPLSSTILYSVFMTAAGMTVLAVFSESIVQARNALKRLPVDTDFIFLAFWLLAMMIAICVLLPHAPAKYSLPLLAPLVLLMMREAEAGIASRALTRALIVSAVIMTVLVANAVSAADFQMAKSYKHYALNLSGSYETDGTVWFVGEWGFRHYMESQGYQYLTSANEAVHEGDLIVRPGFTDWPLADSVTSRMQPLETTSSSWDMPLRVMSFEGNAGFYGSHWGLLPYAITDAPVENFTVYRVGPPPKAQQ
ncbi:MAG: glycosyltransferase family 39 protein [Thermoleophilia bacterium]